MSSPPPQAEIKAKALAAVRLKPRVNQRFGKLFLLFMSSRFIKSSNAVDFMGRVVLVLDILAISYSLAIACLQTLKIIAAQAGLTA